MKEEIRLYINRIHFHNIMEALIENSIKFSDDPVQIDLHAFTMDHCITIVVKDNGWGIPMAEQERVFNKFFQNKQYQERVSEKGFGMGLSYVKAVTLAMGGDITLDSEEGKRTEMILIFSEGPDEVKSSKYYRKLGRSHVYHRQEDLHRYLSEVFSFHNWDIINIRVETEDEIDDPLDPSIICVAAKPKNASARSVLPFFIFEYYYDVRFVEEKDGINIFVLIKQKDPFAAEHVNFKYTKYIQRRNRARDNEA